MTLITGNGRCDALGTAGIGVLLVLIAIVLALETKSLLLGESATAKDVAAIEAALVGEGVASVIHLRTLHLGPEELLVAAKIEVAAAVERRRRRRRDRRRRGAGARGRADRDDHLPRAGPAPHGPQNPV